MHPFKPAKSEPKPRKDGNCVVCGKTVPGSPYADKDAFCSTVCCRVYFGTTLIVTTSTSTSMSKPS